MTADGAPVGKIIMEVSKLLVVSSHSQCILFHNLTCLALKLQLSLISVSGPA